MGKWDAAVGPSPGSGQALVKDPVGPKAGHGHLGNLFLSISTWCQVIHCHLGVAGKQVVPRAALSADTQLASCTLVFFPEVGGGGCQMRGAEPSPTFLRSLTSF